MSRNVRPSAVVALALGASLVACRGGGDGAGGDTVVIGVAGPLELVYGRSMRQAAEMAAEELNAAGGIDGRRIELVIRDDAADAQQAISIANEFVDDARIVAVVGHITSGATLAAAGIYNAPENGLVEISPTASSPLVTNAGPWTFRVCPSDLEHGPALAAWLRERLGRQRAEVLYANDAYGRGVVESFARAFTGAGGTLVGTDPFLPNYVQQAGFLDPYVERGMARNAQGILIGGLADEAIEIIRTARRLGFTGPILGADGLLGVEEAGEVSEGVFVSTPFLPDMPAPLTQQFVAAYRERYGSDPDAYAALTYDALKLVAQAVGEVGSGREAIRDYIEDVGSDRRAYDGVTGRIAFDANGDAEGKPVVIGVIRGGAVVTAATN